MTPGAGDITHLCSHCQQTRPRLLDRVHLSEVCKAFHKLRLGIRTRATLALPGGRSPLAIDFPMPCLQKNSPGKEPPSSRRQALINRPNCAEAMPFDRPPPEAAVPPDIPSGRRPKFTCRRRGGERQLVWVHEPRGAGGPLRLLGAHLPSMDALAPLGSRSNLPRHTRIES